MLQTVIIVAVAVLIGSFAQAISGSGLGLISGGILVAVLGRESGIMLLTVLSVPMMLAVAWQNRSGIMWKRGALIGLTGLACTPLLAAGLRELNQTLLLIVCGVLILMSVSLLYFGLSAPKLANKKGAALVGAMAAVLNMLAGVGSPPTILYAVNAGWDATTTRGTLQLVFLTLAVGTVLSLHAPAWSPQLVASAAVAAAAGTGAGMLLSRKVPAELARLAMLGLAALGGIIVLVSGTSELMA